jgi:hypothetical protein
MSKKILDAIVAGMEEAVARAKRAVRRGQERRRAQRRAGSFSRSEVLALGNAFPTRGQLCHHCGLRIPEFAELNDAGRSRVLYLIRNNRRIMAIRELQSITGCSLLWAKLWVHHAGRPEALHPGPPCPFCGEPLRTSGRSSAFIAAGTGATTPRATRIGHAFRSIPRRAAIHAMTGRQTVPAHTAYRATARSSQFMPRPGPLAAMHPPLTSIGSAMMAAALSRCSSQWAVGVTARV